jgi:hypothetical protein
MTPHEGRMDDAALDREIEQLLTVEASPEFQARVRMRIAGETIAPAAFERWRWFVLRGAVIAAACVAVLVLVVRMNRASHSDVVSHEPATTAVPRSTSPAGPPSARSAGDRASVATPTQTSRVRKQPSDTSAVIPVTSVAQDAARPAVRDPFSDVQVSVDELKALGQIATLMTGKRLELDERTPVAAMRDDVKDLVITPITIEPIQLVMIKGDAE